MEITMPNGFTLSFFWSPTLPNHLIYVDQFDYAWQVPQLPGGGARAAHRGQQ